MTTDWKPKAPSATKAFNQKETQKTTEKTTGRKTVTKEELTKLEGQRERPDTGRVFSPSGATQRASDRINHQREDRIEHLQDRLRRMKNRARDDFDRSR